MISALFFLVLRTVAIPIAAILILKETALGEEGAVIAVGLALLVANAVGILLNLLKILGHTVLFHPGAVLYYITSIIFQIVSVIGIWGFYLSKY